MNQKIMHLKALALSPRFSGAKLRRRLTQYVTACFTSIIRQTKNCDFKQIWIAVFYSPNIALRRRSHIGGLPIAKYRRCGWCKARDCRGFDILEAEKRRNVDAAEKCRRRFDILEAEKRRNVDTADEYGIGLDILRAEKRENVDTAREYRKGFDNLGADEGENVDIVREHRIGLDILRAEKRENVDITDKSMHQGDTSCQQYLNK